MSKKAKNKVITYKQKGLEDINFPEFPLGFCSEKQPKEIKETLVFQDGDNKIYIKPSSLGFPTPSTRDLMRGLMKMAFRKNKFSDRALDTSLREITRELKKTNAGENIKTIKKNLDILVDTRIIFENCYFDRKTSKKIRRRVNIGIIQSYFFEEAKNKKDNDLYFKENPDLLRSGIRWNEDFFNISLDNANN